MCRFIERFLFNRNGQINSVNQLNVDYIIRTATAIKHKQNEKCAALHYKMHQKCRNNNNWWLPFIHVKSPGLDYYQWPKRTIAVWDCYALSKHHREMHIVTSLWSWSFAICFAVNKISPGKRPHFLISTLTMQCIFDILHATEENTNYELYWKW